MSSPPDLKGGEKRWPERVKTAAWVALGLLSLALALREVDFQSLRAILLGADVRFLLLALSSVFLNVLAKAARWRVLLGAGQGGPKPGVVLVLAVVLIGQFINLVFPARAGDVSRVLILGERGYGRSYVLGTLVLEKMIEVFSYALLVVAAAAFAPLPEWLARSVVGIVIGGGGVALALLVSVRYWEALAARVMAVLGKFPERVVAFCAPKLASGLKSLDVFLKPLDVARVAFWTLVVWITAILNNYLVFLALDLRLPLAAAVLLLVVLQAGISTAAVPATIGVFEYLAILTLAGFGVEKTVALGFGLVLHAVVQVPPIVGGFLSVGLLYGFGRGFYGKVLRTDR